MKKIYISGKITGIENEAPSIFEKAEKELQAKGYETINPLKLNHEHDKSWHSYMKEDVKALCDCEAIYMLSNWKESKGAVIEHQIATDLALEFVYEIKNHKGEFRRFVNRKRRMRSLKSSYF